MDNKETIHLNTSGNTEGDEPKLSGTATAAIIAIGIFLILLVAGSIYFLIQPATDTAKIRDIFIIFLAVESIVIGVSLVILLIQLAKLINLFQNEIKPILDSTNETVSNLKGTTSFLSANLVEPVIKMNEYLAGITRVITLTGIMRKKKNKSNTGE